MMRLTSFRHGGGRLWRRLTRARRDLASRQAALEASRTGVCLFASDGPRFWNPAFVRLLGFEPGNSERWVPFLARLAGTFGFAVPDRVTLAENGALRFWTPERYLSVRASATAAGDILITVDNLTEEEHERAIRDRFVAEVVAAQETESRRIAELLHDDAVQQLTALGLRLELAASRSGDESLKALAASAAEITSSLRHLLIELHPAVLESQGLEAAIESAAENLRAQGVIVFVSAPLHPRLPGEIERLAYRAIQEAFANALKHANATQVDVRLTVSGGTVRCQVTDDGVGFDTERATAALGEGHLGLHLVRERIELAGGRFLLDSRPGGGTSFVFELPLPVVEEHERASLAEVAR